ncbi:uncharacterized protein LOC143627270 [Bidens hawaiensis]|uniref:uncharacterized protein LOC143627270 n=1 Tax=Bidens hawaiensis TaxID=980011 RepID=UPI00404B7DCF
MSSFIALIPKKKDPVGLVDFRPISLIGCINKVVSKVLVGRLKSVIGGLILVEQSAFLANRSILDGPLVLNEVVAWLNKSGMKGMLFKVDIDKAYDSVNWGYLDSIMIQMGFLTRWRRWVNAIIVSARASVLVNGSRTREFQCTRGIRQGDPLSPLLFLIAMVGLSGILKEAVSKGFFHGIRVGHNGPTLSHFLYADDAVFLGEWNTTNAVNLKRILRVFHAVSGLKVNLNKCRVFGTKVDDGEVLGIARILHCRMEGKKPFVWGSANGYKIGVKFASDLLLFVISAPEGVLRKLERIRRVFFWGGTEDKAKINWVAWDKVTPPVGKGGLGLGSLSVANLALLAKWWWRFKQEKNGLWRKAVWAIHHTARSWNFIPVRMAIAGPWRNIGNVSVSFDLLGINLWSNMKWVIGSGSDSMFWIDNWIGDSPLKERFPLLFKLERMKGCKVGERLVIYERELCGVWSWYRQLVSTNEINEFRQLLILCGGATVGDGIDRLIWALDGSGDFSINSIKKCVGEWCYPGATWVFGWNNWIPKRVCVLAWRVGLERVASLVELAKGNIVFGSVLCPLCGEVDETVEHIFTSCSLHKMCGKYLHFGVIFQIAMCLVSEIF